MLLFKVPVWNKGCIYQPFSWTVSFKKSFLLYAIKEWNKLDSEIRIVETNAFFRKMFPDFIGSTRDTTHHIYNLNEIRLLTKLWLGFRSSLEHKFRHNFADSPNPLCSCSLETDTTLNFFLHCQNYTNLSRAFLTELKNVMYMSENDLLHVIMYGNKNISFIEDSEKFDQPLF